MAECLALERINRLLDEGSFVEVGAYVSARITDFTLKSLSEPSDGIITGYGQIEGNPVFVYSQNRDVLNGTMGEMHAKKICNLYDMAAKTKTPVIGFLDCGGFRLQESVDALDGFARVLAKQAECAGSVPMISAVMGNCAGGLTMIPALSDFTFMAKGAQMFVNPPHTLRDDPDLARNYEASTYQDRAAGLAEVLETEDEVLDKIRALVLMLTDDAYGCCGEEDLNRRIPEQAVHTGDARMLLRACADDGFLEIRPGYCPEMVTGFLKLNGICVGAVGNASALYDGDGAKQADLTDGLSAGGCRKAAEFLRFCNDYEIPVLSVTAADGFAAASETERMLPHTVGSLIREFARKGQNSRVNLIIGDTYGSAYVAMNAKALGGADMVLAWDGVKVGMMEAEKAANILFADGEDAQRQRQASAYEARQNAVAGAAARGSIDAVIAPEETRKHLIMAFSML